MVSVQFKSGSSSDELETFAESAGRASAFLKAISHEARLMILCILAEGEKSVTEIESILGLQQAVVSQQLARLRQEDVVETRREGRQIYYRIANPDIHGIINALYSMFCQTAGVCNPGEAIK
ncbi:helix-turn-helix transcriptional regulator [Rhizobium sp. L1K21]|uniref:ArsR/SmtB family transcription factor n=1 Tax=Rhizobium sp. L1K21 TaxID=2954933 RepID=UPI002093E787|nr:metalloregulator ArsR/SmtB family transcription factor [Rhizobium sp. L1K21]MCO6184911.1 metalloregulator ArsR/SmtB family transcription factor [Rhizobium sp. L1K21]